MERTPATPPVTAAEYRATGVLLGAFLATIALSVLLAIPFLRAGYRAFEDPGNVGNSFYYLGLILVFTFVILWIAKKGWTKIIQIIILGAVASTVLYVISGLLTGLWDVAYGISVPLGLVGGIGIAVWLYKNPEWYVIDIAGLLVASAAAAIFGISLAIVPTIVLLVALAIYDAIAVYKTKHMLTLADTVIDLRLPVLMVVPKHRGYRFREDARRLGTKAGEGASARTTQKPKEEREAMFMGLGDLVMPTILVVSALTFLPGAAPDALQAEFTDVHTTGDLSLDIRVDVPAQGTLPLTVNYHLDGPADTAWTFDYDLDGDVDATGEGLPTTITAQYDTVTGILVTLEGASGNQTGTAQVAGALNEPGPWYTPALGFFSHGPALGAAIGTLVGFGALMVFVLRGNPQAGLPLLNGGSIAGFLVGLWATTGSIVFW